MFCFFVWTSPVFQLQIISLLVAFSLFLNPLKTLQSFQIWCVKLWILVKRIGSGTCTFALMVATPNTQKTGRKGCFFPAIGVSFNLMQELVPMPSLIPLIKNRIITPLFSSNQWQRVWKIASVIHYQSESFGLRVNVSSNNDAARTPQDLTVILAPLIVRKSIIICK